MLLILLLTNLVNVFAFCPQNGIDVFFVAGQSNAVGTGKVSEIPEENLEIINNHPNKLIWNYQTQSIEELKLGVNNNLLHGWNGIFGPEAMIGNHLQNQSDKAFIIFKYAYAGSSLHKDWNSRIAGTYYHSMMEQVRKMENYLLNQNKIPCYRAFFWSQGGADTGPHDVDDYAENLENFINDLRSDLKESLLPFITARLNRVKEENRFHRQQDKLLKRIQAFKIIETRDLPQDEDSIHFNAIGQIMFGERFYNAYLNLLKDIENGLNVKNLIVYPVPFTKSHTEMNIKIQNNFYCHEGRVELIDMLGRLVFEKNNIKIEPQVDTIISFSQDELYSIASAAYILSVKLDQCSVDLDDSDKIINKKIIIL